MLTRDPYTGAVTDPGLPPTLRAPLTEERVREIVREEIEAALAFFEEQTTVTAFERRVSAAMRNRMEGIPR